MENPFDRSSKRTKYETGDSINQIQIQNERNWADLPTDCLVSVFKKVGTPDLTLNAQFVCKSWYRASLDPTSWMILEMQDVDLTLHDCPFIERFKNRYRVYNFGFRAFVRFLLWRSKNRATLLNLGNRRYPLSDMVYIFKRYPKLDIITWKGMDSPNFMREYILKLDEALERNIASWIGILKK